VFVVLILTTYRSFFQCSLATGINLCGGMVFGLWRVEAFVFDACWFYYIASCVSFGLCFLCVRALHRQHLNHLVALKFSGSCCDSMSWFQNIQCLRVDEEVQTLWRAVLDFVRARWIFGNQACVQAMPTMRWLDLEVSLSMQSCDLGRVQWLPGCAVVDLH